MKRIFFIIALLISPLALSETVEIEKRFAIKMLVSSYVNGFKKYDTTVVGFDDSVSIGIYIDRDNQTREGAEILEKRFLEQVPKLLKLNTWSKDTKVNVTIY